jgi:hypothetical protein
VPLVYSCDIQDTGSRCAVEVGRESIEGEVRATPGTPLCEPHSVGNLPLRQGPAELHVRVLEAPGQELMRLNRVRLEKK